MCKTSPPAPAAKFEVCRLPNKLPNKLWKVPNRKPGKPGKSGKSGKSRKRMPRTRTIRGKEVPTVAANLRDQRTLYDLRGRRFRLSESDMLLRLSCIKPSKGPGQPHRNHNTNTNTNTESESNTDTKPETEAEPIVKPIANPSTLHAILNATSNTPSPLPSIHQVFNTETSRRLDSFDTRTTAEILRSLGWGPDGKPLQESTSSVSLGHPPASHKSCPLQQNHQTLPGST
ncbi:hypothetical protein RhiJN_09065 [Ceratobasidium sp. AG-Ba]|nr:hypothetical protein RhiJN_09065 [Ceratobasidium sp. AG-Ba]